MSKGSSGRLIPAPLGSIHWDHIQDSLDTADARRTGCSHHRQIMPIVGLQYPPGRKQILVSKFTYPESPGDILSPQELLTPFYLHVPGWAWEFLPLQVPGSPPAGTSISVKFFWSLSYFIWSTPLFPLGKEVKNKIRHPLSVNPCTILSVVWTLSSPCIGQMACWRWRSKNQCFYILLHLASISLAALP